MRTCFCILVVLRFTAAYKIITKSMIHSPEDLWYEPVPLKTKDGLTEQISNFESDETTTQNIGRSIDLKDFEDEEYDDSVPPTTETPSNDSSTEVSTELSTELSTEISTEMSTEVSAELTGNRTKLYPIGRLWERTQHDLWSIISEAFGCIWSGVGLDCFTYKVVPMFKSLMGYESYNPIFSLPRSLSQDDDIEGRVRRRRHHGIKFAKAVLVALVGLKALIIPVLVGLTLISGKALFVSLVSGILTAVTAWSTAKNNADRRVQNDTPSQNYYM